MLFDKLKNNTADKKAVNKPTAPQSTKSVVDQKRKKTVWTIAGVIAVVMVFGFLITKKPAPLKVEKPKQNPIAVSFNNDEMQSWTAQSGATLTALQQKIKDQHTSISQNKALLEEIKQSEAAQAKALSKLRDAISEQDSANEQALSQLKSQVGNMATSASSEAATQSSSNGYQQAGGEGSEGVSLGGQIEGAVATVGQSNAQLQTYEPPQPKVQAKPKVTMQANPFYGWLPMGSMFRATLLNGVVAPTGQAGQANPVPVIMKVMTNAILPNDQYRYQLRGCFIMGSASGNASSERVDVRLARISCLNQQGTAVVSSDIKGFVSDSDGKDGLRGQWVSRQGPKIAMATLAGFAQGLSNMFGNAQGNSVITSTGTGVSLGTDEKLRAAGFSGLGQAANTVAQFYINQAKQLYPVIIVNAGRNVTVDLTQGLALHWNNISNAEIPATQTGSASNVDLTTS